MSDHGGRRPVEDPGALDGTEELVGALTSGSRRWVWLDAVAGGWGGSSLVGWLDDEDVSLTYDATTRTVSRHSAGESTAVGDDVFAVLAEELARGPRDARWFGYFGYAARSDMPARPDDRLPDALWMRPSHLRRLQHRSGARHGLPGPRAAPPAAASRSEPSSYRDAFARMQRHLYAGESYEVNLTYRREHHSELDPWTVYRRLRSLNPAPYAGMLQHDLPGERAWLLSASPERYATIRAGTIEARPIKGTTPRGGSAEHDDRLRARLASESRYRAENLMILDLLRNDIGSVARPGTVEVPSLMEVETYPSVHQLVSTVRGRLRAEVGTVEALRALFPAASMTGAPKLRTMEIIDAVEASPRGVYAGAFGYVTARGEADLGVVIRSTTTDGDGRWSIGTGGGITVHSDAASEFAETEWKTARTLEALRAAVPVRQRSRCTEGLASAE